MKAASPDLSPLATTYLERRDDMRRFFLARLGGRGEVEDLVQELYLKVQAVTEDPIENPSAYLYRLASNLMLDRLRQARRSGARETEWRRTHHATVGALDVADTPDAESAVIARQRLEKLASALETLAPLTQRVFRLHKFEGLTHAETAARLGISRSAVEKHVSLALGHLVKKVGR
ncbi:RNA polymerase sigma factor [Caulobacter sp. RL271]|jgi:RNA polymerase sigma-70 factor (ECF subfamily)|uniref:RNA polymerase sigma factor n=1 Tax=Caulobacter segnis TaxID=88688 RepID=A0ABY4ZM81_9CAUL|nr:RNA polymerase sigma factor [Caulobacter segnis]USQ93923.1 RNA polymerase sigma factor [Caulobacter segnis]